MSKLFGGGPMKTEAVMDTLIGKQTEILGDIKFTGGLHLDGKIKGKVIAEGSGKGGASLSISESGSVEGDVRVPVIRLNGRVTGDVHASERVHLAARARVSGNVYYKILEMEAGAEINGQLLREGHGPLSAVNSQDHAKLDELSEVRKLKGVGSA